MKIGDERTAEEIMIGVLRQQLDDTKEWLATRSEELAALRAKVDSLFDAIAHGDPMHREWLRGAITNHFKGPTL